MSARPTVCHVAPALADLLVPIASLKLDKANARKHSARNLDSIAESYRTFGQQKPIIIAPDCVVVAGNGQLAAAQKLGWTHIAAVVTNLAGAALRAFALADNRTAELAEWDDDALAKALAAIQDADPLLVQAVGFSEAEIAELLGPKDGLTDPDAVPEPPKKAITRLGDLWLLGDHRLLCGDSTKAEDTARLMNGQKADFVFTDPPYGHNNNDGDLIHKWESALGKPKTASSAARPIANDSPEEAARVYAAFLQAAAGLLSGGGCCCCCCGGGGPDPQFARWALEMDSAIGFKHAVVWDKGGLGMGWHYRRNYEFVLVAEKPGGPCHWYGGTDVGNVIRDIGKIIPSAEQHPTEKPVALPSLFIGLHSKRGEVVWEPFAGHGGTLIACEQLGRRCYAMEIEPKYCDVAVRRWEEFTGKKATREEAR